MSASAPPTWRWLDECYVPVETQELPDSATLSKQNDGETLSAGSCNLSDSATLGVQNDSNPDPTYQDCWPSERYKSDGPRSGEFWNANARDQCSECRCAPGHSHAKGCDGVQSVRETLTKLPVDPPKCPVCRHDMESDEGVLCDHCEEPTGVESFAVVNGPGGVFLYHLACYDEVYWGGQDDDDRHDDEPVATAESCPECGTVTDIEYGPEPALLPKRETAAVEETFDVPFPVQSWTFEALIETEVDHLHEIIDDHHDEIVKMARRRHRTGHVLHGSKGYQWDAQTRLRNVLEELSDAPTYLTMGAIE